MKKKVRLVVLTLGAFAIGWTLLTFWANHSGERPLMSFGEASEERVLIFYNPDPIYNLDEQISTAIAMALSSDAQVDVVTTLDQLPKVEYSLPEALFKSEIIC